MKIGEPYTLAMCRVCWLFHNDARYHQLWGGTPTLLQKVKGFFRSAKKHAAGGLQQVSEEEYQRRIGICRVCDFFKEDYCLKCGCQLKGKVFSKARWKSEACPLKKW
jgi:hypothetical protein